MSRKKLDSVRHLLGKVPDAELADRAGLHRATIAKARVEAGIPILRKKSVMSIPSKTVPVLHLLGTASDASLARQAGVTRELIRKARAARGIPSVPLFRPSSRVNVEMLGTAPDADIAQQCGSYESTVRKIRQKRGIKAFAEPTMRESIVAAAKARGTLRISEMRALFPDAAVQSIRQRVHEATAAGELVRIGWGTYAVP